MNKIAKNNNLQIVNISKSYGERKILSKVNLHINRGEITGLLGPNGAGKTTCFYIIAGLIRADRGEIILNGTNVTSFSMYQRSRMGLSYLPQEPSIFRGLTVAENIMAVLEFTEDRRSARQDRLHQILEIFKLSHLHSVLSTSLSGGERRRLEIARSIASKPQYMLLDEPFAGVDPVSIDDICELMNLLKEQNIGVLITDHNVRETLKVVDRAYIVHNGEIIKQGDADTIVKDEMVRKVYLGSGFNFYENN
jgi:lipopolysaccharide export system ATP-binding protein